MATCVACGASNPPEAGFCGTCGAALAAPCAACGAPLAPDARFCSACGTPVAVETGAEERKLVTILFADVTGSTTLGERLDPERLRDVLATYFAAMREEIEAQGGTVEKFIGDAVMAAFGVPTAHEDDPERALRAARRMLERLVAVNDELSSRHDITLQIRIGINTGEALATTDPRPREAMVTGDVVNTAARLEAAAEPGEVLVGERTARAVRGFRFGDPRELLLKGKAEAVTARELLEETSLGIERGVPGLRAPMVGRDAELDVVRSIYQRVSTERRPHLVTVYGEAGVGKSRLTREFLAWTADQSEPPLVLSGRCLPYGDGITYWPLAEILKGHAGILDTDPPELALDKVRKAGRDLITSEFAPDPVRATAALAYTVGLEDPETSFAAADPRDVRDELHSAWRSFFSALSSAGPIVVVIEDIHWADPVLLDLLEELSDRADGPALFVCPSRPELGSRRPGWGGGRRNASAVALDPLTQDESDRLIRLLLAIDDLPPSTHNRILERAEGNPFYLEEIVRSLIDGGFLVHEGARWTATSGIEQVDIPDTVQAVLASRIDLLEPSHKRVLQAAAVVGRVFWPGPVAELTGSPAASLSESLRLLEARELVLSRAGSTLAGQPEHMFKHVLTRDVAYESLPRRERAPAHRAVASWIERTAGERRGEFAELLAYHYATAVRSTAEAGEAPDPELRAAALRWLLRASSEARRRLVVRKAQRLAEHAVDLAMDVEERVDALERLAEACFDAYEGDLAWRYFGEAARLLAGSGADQGERVASLSARACEIPQRWPGSIRGAPPSEREAQELYDLGRASLPEGDSEARIRLLSVRAGWLFGYPPISTPTDDEVRSFEAAGTEAADVAIRMGNPNLASGALDAANAAWAASGNYGRVLPLWGRRFELLPSITDPLEIGDCYAMGAWVHYELGDYPKALEIVDAGLPTITGRGPNVELHVRGWYVVTLYRVGLWDQALEESDRVSGLLDERRDDPPYFITQAIGAAATIHEVRGDRAESERLAATMARIAGAESGRMYPFYLRYLVVRGDLESARALPLPTLWAVHANDVYEARSELTGALEAWGEAPELAATMRAHAEATGTVALVPFADRLEGRSAMAAGDAATAAALFERSAATFEQLGVPWERALSDLDRAQALAELDHVDLAADAATQAARTFRELRDVKHLPRAEALGARS